MSNLIIPSYSMRSYTDNRYSLLKDGNFKIAINRCNKDDIVCIPTECSDLQEALELGILRKPYVELKYGTNVGLSRNHLWDYNDARIKELVAKYQIDNIVSDFSKWSHDVNHVNMLNVSYVNGFPRPYVDKFLARDISSIRRGSATYFLNVPQLESVQPFLERQALRKVIVNRQIVRASYYKRIEPIVPALESFDIFFPFRLTDKGYDFEKLLQNHGDKKILVTDPNDTLHHFKNTKNVTIAKLNKQEFYGVLSTKPRIIYYESFDRNFHCTTADFVYFGCKIETPHDVPTYEQLIIPDNADYLQMLKQ